MDLVLHFYVVCRLFFLSSTTGVSVHPPSPIPTPPPVVLTRPVGCAALRALVLLLYEAPGHEPFGCFVNPPVADDDPFFCCVDPQHGFNSNVPVENLPYSLLGGSKNGEVATHDSEPVVRWPTWSRALFSAGFTCANISQMGYITASRFSVTLPQRRKAVLSG